MLHLAPTKAGTPIAKHFFPAHADMVDKTQVNGQARGSLNVSRKSFPAGCQPPLVRRTKIIRPGEWETLWRHMPRAPT